MSCIFKTDTTLVALGHFLGVILEALQRGQSAGVDNYAVTQQTNLSMSGQLAIDHVTTGDNTDFGYGEGLLDFCLAEVLFLDIGGEHAAHSVFDFSDQLVDDVVEADFHFFALCNFLDLHSRSYVKADNDRL